MIGRNLEEMRVESQLSDSEVLTKGGIKSSTWTNLKAGKNVTMTNLIKALKGLNRLDLLEPLADYERPVGPMSLVRDSGGLKRRIRTKKNGREDPEGKSTFQWGDEL